MRIPAPTILDPSSVPALRWGVMGPGEIASTFVSSVVANTAQKVAAVASRTPGKAEAFAPAHGIGSVSSSYQELVERDDLDAIYIASYPSDHAEHALLAIAAGKHVLIEKPLALSSADAQRVLSAARSAGVLAMEAMWTRFLPATLKVRETIASNNSIVEKVVELLKNDSQSILLKKGSIERITIRDICDAAKEKDSLAVNAIAEAAIYIGMVISNLINILLS